MSDFWLGFFSGIGALILLQILIAVIWIMRRIRKFRGARYKVDKKQEEQVEKIIRGMRK